MDHNFSEELKDLVRRTRETAIAMGYDYISTIHFFIADAESKDACSIFKFSFKDELSYFDFRKKHTVTKTNLPAHINESLPLTLEAEKTIRLAEKERILFQQYKSLPCHFFIAALKNKESVLAGCFNDNENIAAELVNYYKMNGELDIYKIKERDVSNVPANEGGSVLDIFFSLFKNKKQP